MSTNTSIHEYNLTLSASSPFFTYQPYRDGPETLGWNSSYTFSNTWDPGNAWGSGAAYRKTAFEGSQVSISFTGTGIYLCFTRLSSSYTFAVDQQPSTTAGSPTDAACAPFSQQGASVGNLVYAKGLAPGKHTVTLELSVADFSSEFYFFGGVVTLDVGDASWTASAPKYINNDAPQWTYLPSPSASRSWFDSQNATSGDYNTDREVTCDYSQATTASYIFSNTSAVWLLGGVQANTLGYSITLDSTTSTYNASNFYITPQQVLFAASGLDPTVNHTITATNFNANAPQGGGCLNVDALVLLQVTPPPANTTGSTGSDNSGGSTNGRSGSSTPVGAIVGGAIGGLAALCILALLLFCLRRRHQRKQAQLLPHPLTAAELPSPFPAPLPVSPAGVSTNGTYASDGKSRPSLTPQGSEGTVSSSALPSPPLVPVLEKQPLPPAENGSARRDKRHKAGVKRKPVPRAVDSEAALAAGLPVLPSASSLASSPPNSPPTPAISSPSLTITPSSPSIPAAEGYARAAQSSERRARPHRPRPERTPEEELQQASTMDIVELLSRRFSSRGRRESRKEPPPGYDEAGRP